MPPFAARPLEARGSLSEGEILEREETALKSRLYTQMSQVMEFPDLSSKKDLSHKGVYRVEGQREDERTRAWVLAYPQHYEFDLYVDAIRWQDGKTFVVPGSEQMILKLDFNYELTVGEGRQPNVMERVRILKDAIDTVREIENGTQFAIFQSGYNPEGRA